MKKISIVERQDYLYCGISLDGGNGSARDIFLYFSSIDRKLIEYASTKLMVHDKNYPTTDLELAA